MLCSHLTRGVMGMPGQFGVHAVQTDRVSDFTNCETSFVQNGDDPLVWLLHKINDDLVVEVINLHINSTAVSKIKFMKQVAICVTACVFSWQVRARNVCTVCGFVQLQGV